jgi:hypothetical protein
MQQTVPEVSQCPIGIICSGLLDNYSSENCPNRGYCNRLAEPWMLPYIYGISEDETKLLKVRLAFEHLSLVQARQVREELAAIGFAVAWQLPYEFYSTDDNNKALVVVNPCPDATKEGWLEAEELSGNYFVWCAAKVSKTFSDYEDFTSINFHTDHWLYHQKQYYPLLANGFFHDQIDDIPF